MKAVKFLSKQPTAVAQSRYNAGEIAGFADAVADDLVKRGIAEYYKAETKAPEKESKPLEKKAVVKKSDKESSSDAE